VAGHWDLKRAVDPNFQNKAAQRIKNLRTRLRKWRVPFYIENPETGKLKEHMGSPNFDFHPYEYGRYLPEGDAHPSGKGFPPRDAYKKKTGLWFGCGFKPPKKRAVAFTTFSIEQVPSKERSYTPRGFARAVCLEHYERV
jgi:hypothetical protein